MTRLGEAVFTTILVLAFTLAIGSVVSMNVAESRCNAAGFAHTNWHPIAPNYCMKRVGGTDVVVRADSLPPTPR